MATALSAISIDGADIGRLAQFWADVLDQPANAGAADSYAAGRNRPADQARRRVQLNEIEQGGGQWRTFADPESNEFDLVASSHERRR